MSLTLKGLQARWRSLTRLGLWLMAVSLLLLEIALRVLAVDEGGHTRLWKWPLAPLAPLNDAQVALLGQPTDQLPYLVPDAELGWSIRSMGRSERLMATSDALGLRCAESERGRDPIPPAAMHTVLLVGDSFTHGSELPYASTWAQHLSDAMGTQVAVRNGGVPGFGVDQAVLRAERLMPILRPEVVILGIYRQNLLRNLTVFRAVKNHAAGIPYGKPRFVLRGADLELVHHPVTPPGMVAQRLANFDRDPLRAHDSLWWPALHREGSMDWSIGLRFVRTHELFKERAFAWGQHLEAGGEGVQVGLRICERFCRSVRAAGVRPLIVLLPDELDLRSLRETGAALAPAFGAALGESGLEVINLGQELARVWRGVDDLSTLFCPRGHPGAAITGHFATAIAGRLAELH